MEWTADRADSHFIFQIWQETQGQVTLRAGIVVL